MAQNVLINEEIHKYLIKSGVDCNRPPNSYSLPINSRFEAPCSIKSLTSEMSLQLGAYSYAVSGYYFGVEIGRYCSIGEGVQIGRHSHPLDFGSTSPLFYTEKKHVLGKAISHDAADQEFSFRPTRQPTVFKPTKIGNDVYIGHDAFIMPGISIGDGAIIGARSVVTKDVPSYSIVAGVPAKIIRKRFTQTIIDELTRTQWWKFSLTQLIDVQPDNPMSFAEACDSLLSKGEEHYKPGFITINQFFK